MRPCRCLNVHMASHSTAPSCSSSLDVVRHLPTYRQMRARKPKSQVGGIDPQTSWVRRNFQEETCLWLGVQTRQHFPPGPVPSCESRVCMHRCANSASQINCQILTATSTVTSQEASNRAEKPSWGSRC